MTLKQFIAIGIMAALPLAAFAQGAPSPSDPADAKAAVPALIYESAFAGYVPLANADDDITPDKRWRAANATVAQSEGHAEHAARVPEPGATPTRETPVDHSKH